MVNHKRKIENPAIGTISYCRNITIHREQNAHDLEESPASIILISWDGRNYTIWNVQATFRFLQRLSKIMRKRRNGRPIFFCQKVDDKSYATLMK